MSDFAHGPLDRLLHRLALGSKSIAEATFALDQSLFPTGKPGRYNAASRPVFVTGLARAGTTILMRRLHASGAFRSLTYRDMPFVLAPRLGQKLTGKRREFAPTERAHGDGLEISLDSPECLDEVFWRVFCGENYIGRDALVPHRVDEATVERFRIYVAAILDADPKQPRRYLSKNNNNILRLPAILAAFPSAVVLVPWREPLAHAHSLWTQHRNFLARAKTDPFTARYMGWLAHHEFGPGHRPFRFPDDDTPLIGTPDDLAYWLDLWCRTYDFLLAHKDRRMAFVSYDALCADPSIWAAVAARAGIPADRSEEIGFRAPPRPEISEPVPAKLLARARTIADALGDQAALRRAA